MSKEGTMTDQHHQDLIEKVVQQIRADFPSAPHGMSDDEFDRLCTNIARAVAAGIQHHENRYHQLSPEFGEPQRPED
jgi:hypothetical protein